MIGANTDFLKPVASITTQVESGGLPTSTPDVTTDFGGTTRPTGTGTNPDLSAWEFEGVTPAPIVVLNSVSPAASTLLPLHLVWFQLM